MDNFQRIDSISNAHVGRAFEEKTRKYSISQGLTLEANHSIAIGVEILEYDETLSECKAVNKGTACRAPTL